MTSSDDATQPRRGERRESPYQEWQSSEGIPVYTGSYVDNLYTLELADWPRTGQSGAFVNLADQEQDDAWVVELAPAGNTEVQHHLCEATVFVLTGRGATRTVTSGSWVGSTTSSTSPATGSEPWKSKAPWWPTRKSPKPQPWGPSTNSKGRPSLLS